ncbi:hypothetical protein TRAPUB_11332 [Trametes pubescens]|uniref:Uncharacterized protein n=1 Tax=Trametes pubescens TaxID=154538 RepID=A0A1M2VWX1_TRAPU|nr:hypothetical protein TRAPUB_11332 [Trametes pubescens]
MAGAIKDRNGVRMDGMDEPPPKKRGRPPKKTVATQFSCPPPCGQEERAPSEVGCELERAGRTIRKCRRRAVFADSCPQATWTFPEEGVTAWMGTMDSTLESSKRSKIDTSGSAQGFLSPETVSLTPEESNRASLVWLCRPFD